MEIEFDSVDGIQIIKICSNSLDATNSEDFKKSMDSILDEAKELIINLKDVQFMDSVGCSTLIYILKSLGKQYRSLKLCCVSKEVQTLLEMIRVDRIIEIHDSQQEAIQSFQ